MIAGPAMVALAPPAVDRVVGRNCLQRFAQCYDERRLRALEIAYDPERKRHHQRSLDQGIVEQHSGRERMRTLKIETGLLTPNIERLAGPQQCIKLAANAR